VKIFDGGTDAGAPASAAAPVSVSLCNLPVSKSVAGLPNVRPFTQKTPHCQEDPFCDFVEQSPEPADTCFVARDNIARAEQQSRLQKTTKAKRNKPWDGVKKPRYLDRIDDHLHLSSTEHRALRNNGFVVLDRLAYRSYPSAFHSIFQEQLPLYVGIDPILHAVFRGTERALERVERKRLLPALRSMLKKLRTTLKHSTSRWSAEIRSDLDIYLGVAWALHKDHAIDPSKLSLFGGSEAINELMGGDGLVEVSMFGRKRMIDFSQLQPRGHYTTPAYHTENLAPYFSAVMWLSRLELNLVSRSSRSSQPGMVPNPAETPREARVAMALAELVTLSGATKELREFDRIYEEFAGYREDVSMSELSRLMRRARAKPTGPKAFEKLKAAIGTGYRRTARTHFMPQGATELPVIATLLGPRIVPDIAPLTQLVHDKTSYRLTLGGADVAYLLGHDRAKTHLAKDLQKHTDLGPALRRGRAQLGLRARASKDIYGSWLRSILAISQPPRGVVPSFMRRTPYQDHRINSALVGYGQIRHAYVLLAAQGYDAYGCEIPDAYVEPLAGVFDALLTHVRRMKKYAKGWDGLLRVLTMLRSIVRTEVRGHALSEPQKRWLGMVAEHLPVGGFRDTGEPPKWTGWYFDMFEDREIGANRTPAFIADYFTLNNADKVAYLGAEGPRLGVFVIDVGGEPRAMVGPVAKGYEAFAPIKDRLNDETALSYQHKSAKWRASFAIAPQADPDIGLEGRIERCGSKSSPEWRVGLRSDTPLASVTIRLRDHHADPLTLPLTVEVDSTWRAHSFALPLEVASSHYGVEAFDLLVADPAIASGSFHYFTSPSVYAQQWGPDNTSLPTRPRGVGAFAIGKKEPPAR